MRRSLTAVLTAFGIACLAALGMPYHRGGKASAGHPITVAAYYFPDYHPDARLEAIKGPGWSEWELVRVAKPRFSGEQEPKVPLWGYSDESHPKEMERKIAAAADHGINVFIFDWYYYAGPFLQGALDQGFLKAPNADRMKFALMWANHDWLDIEPYKRGTPYKVLFPGRVTPDKFDEICDLLLKSYFLQPSYWRINGKPYFSFYDLTNLLASFGSVQATRDALDSFRTKAIATGLPGLHLNAVVWGQPILPRERSAADVPKLLHDLGFDSVTSYTWIHHVSLPEMQTDYDWVRDQYLTYWEKAVQTFDLPYYPNVTVGWDPSPRADQDQTYGNFGYPFMNTITGNTPERFREALQLVKDRLLTNKTGPRVVTINAWNEWTEGSYLEPDTIHFVGYLDAIRDVFGSCSHRCSVALRAH